MAQRLGLGLEQANPAVDDSVKQTNQVKWKPQKEILKILTDLFNELVYSLFVCCFSLFVSVLFVPLW